MTSSISNRVIVIGAGIGGLSAAVDLATAGMNVTVIEQAYSPGGMLRQIPSEAGPVNVGPTVLTMRSVFEGLFTRAGTRLDDHVTLTKESVLARHWWQDGSSLDLFADPDESAKAIADFAGNDARQEFIAFSKNARHLFETFNKPLIQNPTQSRATSGKAYMRDLRQLLPAMAHGRSLASSLEKSFSDPRLRQLFGRYAINGGSSPFAGPAFLSMIWDVESRGAWRVEGGLPTLAKALEEVARNQGTQFQYGALVEDILVERGRIAGVVLNTGERVNTDRILFNGDPAALFRGMLGNTPRRAVKRARVTPRSLSAYVWAFAAKPSGVDLQHHNVFFGHDHRREFDALARGKIPDDPTLCLCAQDRGDGRIVPEVERFEIVMTGAPIRNKAAENSEDFLQCRTRTFQKLHRMNLNFDAIPERTSLITPGDFAVRFPGSDGSLTGGSQTGVLATVRRPTLRTRIPGLYLAGGGLHPGAGMPMASLSGQHAAKAIVADHASTSR